MINCPDCAVDAIKATMVFDAKQMGEVCPRCERVFSLFIANPDNKHYASEKARNAAMSRDRDRPMHRSVSTQAIVSRILKPID